MQKVKYGVWFHGNKDESKGLCCQGREPFITENKSCAEDYLDYMKSGVSSLEDNLFSLCKITIDVE